MRSICGAIITAAALIGLGLTALGIGTRYQGERPYIDELHGPEAESAAKQAAEKAVKEGKEPPNQILKPGRVKLGDMERPLIFILVFLTSMALVGLGIAFLGLMYHHVRRDREFAWEKERAAPPQRTTV